MFRKRKSPKLKRPAGVTIIVILFILQALSLLVYDTLILLEVGILGAPQPLAALGAALRSGEGFFLVFRALMVALLFGLTVVVITGLYHLRPWAWTLAMIILGVRLALGIIDYFYRAPFFSSMFMQVLAVWLLNQESIRIAFGEKVSAHQEILSREEGSANGLF
jgi:hypothetical protein